MPYDDIDAGPDALDTNLDRLLVRIHMAERIQVLRRPPMPPAISNALTSAHPPACTAIITVAASCNPSTGAAPGRVRIAPIAVHAPLPVSKEDIAIGPDAAIDRLVRKYAEILRDLLQFEDKGDSPA